LKPSSLDESNEFNDNSETSEDGVQSVENWSRMERNKLEEPLTKKVPLAGKEFMYWENSVKSSIAQDVNILVFRLQRYLSDLLKRKLSAETNELVKKRVYEWVDINVAQRRPYLDAQDNFDMNKAISTISETMKHILQGQNTQQLAYEIIRSVIYAQEVKPDTMLKWDEDLKQVILDAKSNVEKSLAEIIWKTLPMLEDSANTTAAELKVYIDKQLEDKTIDKKTRLNIYSTLRNRLVEKVSSDLRDMADPLLKGKGEILDSLAFGIYPGIVRIDVDRAKSGAIAELNEDIEIAGQQIKQNITHYGKKISDIILNSLDKDIEEGIYQSKHSENITHIEKNTQKLKSSGKIVEDFFDQLRKGKTIMEILPFTLLFHHHIYPLMLTFMCVMNVNLHLEVSGINIKDTTMNSTTNFVLTVLNEGWIFFTFRKKNIQLLTQ